MVLEVVHDAIRGWELEKIGLHSKHVITETLYEYYFTWDMDITDPMETC